MKNKSQKHSIIHLYIRTKRRTVAFLYGWISSAHQRISLLLIIFIFILSCSNEPAIPEDKFLKVYVDLLILQDTTSVQSLSLDSMKTIVFSRHNITSDQYEETINYYNTYPEKWEAFFDKAIAYAEELKKKAEK